MMKQGIFFALLLCLTIILPCAGQVTLLAGQKDYYFLVGEDAVLPLIMNNTYNHDVTGVLRLTTITEKQGGNVTTVQEKTFTLFTSRRAYLLPVGRADTPVILHSTIVFSYSGNDGRRRASLEDIVVHFVKTENEIQVNQDPWVSTDSPDPEAGASSSISGSDGKPPSPDPLQKVQNNQVRQDAKSLQQQLQNEDAESLLRKKEFLSLLMQDPITAAINRSLVNDGFVLAGTEVSDLTNLSGNFSVSYEKTGRSAVVSGSGDEGRILFADESSASIIPLPDVLGGNGTFLSFENDLAQTGYSRNVTMMHYTPDRIFVNLTYGDTQNRYTHMRAAISNGTVTSIERDPIDEPSPYLIPFLSIVLICLMSAGIVLLSLRLPRSPPTEVEKPEPEVIPSGYREVTGTILDEAEAMAGQGHYPDAYARAGQALRFVLSQRLSDGRELTNEEVIALLSPHNAGGGMVIETLGRCSIVAFAKGTPDPEEFTRIVAFIREYLSCE